MLTCWRVFPHMCTLLRPTVPRCEENHGCYNFHTWIYDDLRCLRSLRLSSNLSHPPAEHTRPLPPFCAEAGGGRPGMIEPTADSSGDIFDGGVFFIINPPVGATTLYTYRRYSAGAQCTPGKLDWPVQPASYLAHAVLVHVA